MKDTFLKWIGWILFFFWVCFIVYFTIIHRKQGEIVSYNLHLFWCIKDAWCNKNPQDWFYVIANIGVFIPLGMILPAFFGCFRNLWKVAVAGFGMSVSIELIQLFSYRGFFEFDDMFNNTLGAVLGYGIFLLVFYLFHIETGVTRAEQKIAAGGWIFVILFIIIALLLGQPVFDAFDIYLRKYI